VAAATVGGGALHGSVHALNPASRREARRRDGRRPLLFMGGNIGEDAATPAESYTQEAGGPGENLAALGVPWLPFEFQQQATSSMPSTASATRSRLG